jgi:hypothetical protein
LSDRSPICCRSLLRTGSGGAGWDHDRRDAGTDSLIVYLAFALPDVYLVHDWTATWVGFDLLLLALMAATVVFGLLRRQVILLMAFATGTLLLCDVWFSAIRMRLPEPHTPQRRLPLLP